MKDILAPVVRAVKNGIGWKERPVYWVKIDEPDAHFQIKWGDLRLRTENTSINIAMVPWDKEGNNQLRQKCYPDFQQGSLYYRLRFEILEWLEKAGYNYALSRRWENKVQGWMVGFEDKKQAAHFKLAWGFYG